MTSWTLDASKSHHCLLPMDSSSSYYSVDAILTDSQKAPCTFDLAVPRLSALNNGSAIENGTKLELPLWMADMLAMSKPAGPSSASLASLDMPTALGPRVINALKADPKSVDIKAQARWFYGLGERMLDLFEEEELTEVLNDVSMFCEVCSRLELIRSSADVQAARIGDCR